MNRHVTKEPLQTMKANLCIINEQEACTPPMTDTAANGTDNVIKPF